MSGLLWLLFYCHKNIQNFFFENTKNNYKIIKESDNENNIDFEIV